MTHNEEKNQSTETHQEWTQMQESADKVIQAVVLAVVCMFINLEERWDMLGRDILDILKIQVLILEMKTIIYEIK